MKKCTVCKEMLDLSEFNKNRTKKDGLQAHCKKCSRARFQAYWENNKDKQSSAVKERKRRYRIEVQRFIFDFLSQNPCVDCGNSDIRVLEFDHTRDKTMDVSRMMRHGYSIARLQEEIDKCEIRCRNCHIIKTYERLGGSWRERLLEEI